jgi:hypothetical protein
MREEPYPWSWSWAAFQPIKDLLDQVWLPGFDSVCSGLGDLDSQAIINLAFVSNIKPIFERGDDVVNVSVKLGLHMMASST